MHLMILCPVWLLLGTFPASAWSWTKDGFVDSVLSEYGKYDQAARADTVKDGVITESEFMTSLYRQADVYGNNDNKVSRDEFIDYYGQRFNISSELGTVMFDILNDANSRDEFITSADVSISSFSGKNYATVVEFRDGLEKWLRQSADKLYSVLMSPHVLDTKREPEIKYSVIISSVDANNDDVISTEELNDELKRMNSNQPVRRRDWVWRNTQRYGTDPVTANLAFDYWDRDRDFQLSLRDLQYLADDMDLNGNGKVDHDEFLRFVERGYKLSKRMAARPLTLSMVRCPEPWWDSMGWSPNVDAHRAAMDFDDDLNGWVSLADLRRWLDVFDDDDDKSISRREYTKYHTERYGVNSSVAAAMFDLSDINGDDKINEQDWEFHFRDGFSLSFCDARRSILDLTRMAEQFRGVRQGRELRDSMQRRLQEEWSWYLQNKQQDASPNRYLTETYDRDSNSRQQDVCGSRSNCYVGEYTEAWGQPGAWLWWGVKGNLGRPEVLQTPFSGNDGSLSRPSLGFPSPVNNIPNQINRFIGQGSQIGRDPRPPSGIPGPVLGGPGPALGGPGAVIGGPGAVIGGPGPMFDQPPWLGILSMDPIAGVGPFPRFRRALDNDGNKSEKSENSNYFSTYHRLRSPFSESAPEPTSTPVFTAQQSLPEQRHDADKQHQDPVQRENVDQRINSNAESSRIRSNTPEPQRIRTPVGLNDEPAEKPKTEKNQDEENLDVDQSWLTSQFPIMGYPVVLGFDPWMFGGYPNWGLLGRKKREDGGDIEENASPQQDDVEVNADGENGSVDSVNGTVDGDDFEEWESTMATPPGFGMLPWDFWMAWNFDSAMWDLMRLLHELNNQNGTDASNDTDTDDSQQSESGQLLETNQDPKEDEHAEEGSNSRKTRSSDDKAQAAEVKETKESVNITKDHDKRFAQIPANRYGSYWPFFPNRGRPQYIPVFARYWPVMIPPPRDYRMWRNTGSASNFPNPWINPFFPQYPWPNGNGQVNLWDNAFRMNRFRREAEEGDTESAVKDSDRGQRSQETESSRRDSSQGNENSAGDTNDSVWRSAARKYATKENWEQQGNEAANDRYDYTNGGIENQNEPRQGRPSQPGWLKNILSGTGDRWSGAQSQQYRSLWDPAYAQAFDGNVMKQNLWNNVATSRLPSGFMTPGPAWPQWDGSFDGSAFHNQNDMNSFGGMDPWAGSPVWMDQWQNSFGGSPRNWLSLRDTSGNFKDIDSLLRLWYGRFSREAQLNATAENKSTDEDEVEKKEVRRKRDALSEEQIREKRWENEFSGLDNPFSSFQQLPGWGAWCKVYWSVVRHKRRAAESDNDKIMKRSDFAKGTKEKRWNEWNDNPQETNWLSSFLDLVCPLALHSRTDFDWQGGVADFSPDASNPYLQLRNKRETGTDNGIPGDATAGTAQTTRLQRWWNSYSNDYDCLEWISSISAWSPWKGWNLLRSSRENVRVDSSGEHSAGTQARSYDNKDSRAVRCREWYRKYRESNRKTRDENSRDDEDVVFDGDSNLQVEGARHDGVHDDGKNTDNSDSQVRQKREIPESDRLKQYGQMNFQPSWGTPYTNYQPWNTQSYPYSQYYQNPAPWFSPDMYSSFRYDSRRNSPFDFVRGLRHLNGGDEEAGHAAKQRQKRSNGDSERSRRFYSPGNNVFGFDWTDQSRWYDNGNQWGWPIHSYNNRPPIYSTFTNYQIPQSQPPIQNWIRQQRNVENVGQSQEGKHNTEDIIVGRKKRESPWTGLHQGGTLGDNNAYPLFGDFRQQANPGFWNDYSWMLKRSRRNTNVETDEGRDKRFTPWANLIPNDWNDLIQQSFGPFRNGLASYPNQFNLGRFSRGVDSKKVEDLSQITKREVVENSKTKRQLSSPPFYSMPQRINWGSPWGYGNVVPLHYNYWGGFPRMYFNGWYSPEALWGAMRFTRESNDNGKVDDSDKTTSETEDLSRGKRWDSANYNSMTFNNDWNRGLNFPFGSGLYGAFTLNQLEDTNNWNTRGFYKRSEKEPEGSRSRRSTSESNKEKRWFGHPNDQQATAFPWRQPFPNAAQSYSSSWTSSVYPQRGFDWQRSNTYPWSDSLKLSQGGPYDRNGDFRLPSQFWGPSWDFDRFPRKSNDQGERIKRDIQQDAQTKRWSGAQSYTSSYQDPLVSQNYPYRGFDRQQSNTYPWSESWKPFQGGYNSGNGNFPLRTQFLGGSWDFQRYPRHLNEQGKSRMKRNTQQDSREKRWQAWSNERFPLNNVRNPYDTGSLGSNQWMVGGNGRADNFWNSGRYPRETQQEVDKQNVQAGKVNKRWLLNEQYQWPTNWPMSGQYQWPKSDRWYPYNYQNSQWGVGNSDNPRYPRKTLNDKGKIKKRSVETWNFNGPWQRGSSEPWSIDPHWNRGGGYINSPIPFGFQGLGEWTSKLYIRQADGGKSQERTKRDTEAKKIEKRWQESYGKPFTNSMNWNWNPYNTGFERRGYYGMPARNWDRGYMTDFYRFQRSSTENTAPDRSKREAGQETRDKRWQGSGMFSNWPDRRQNVFGQHNFYGSQNRFDSGSNWGRVWPNWPQQGWDNVWNRARYRRSVDNSEATKSKRWQQNAGTPWFAGNGQWQWSPDRMSPWSRDWGGRSVFGPETWRPAGGFQWNWPNEASVRKNFNGYGNMWRFPRQTDGATGKDDGGRQKRGAVDNRDKRWQNWNTNPFFNWGSWPLGTTYSNPWFSRFAGYPSFNTRSFFKRDTEESKNDDEAVENDGKQRTKRWQFGTGFPINHEVAYPLGLGNPFGFNSGWGNPFGSGFGPSFNREGRQTNTDDQSKLTTGDNSRKKRSFSDSYFSFAFPNSQNGGVGIPTMNTFPWAVGDHGWENDWNSHRYRRSADGISDETKENVDSGLRNKRQNYWDNVFGNNWNSRAGFPTSFANPWTFGNNMWNSNWNSRRYRRSDDGISEDNKETDDSNVRNKRQNYWDNVSGNNWNSGTGFPTTFANPWISNINGWDSNWNSRRYRRSADEIGEENKEDKDYGIRNKRQNYWDNVFGNNWGRGTGFPTTFANPWTAGNNWWGSNWNSRRYRRSTDGIDAQNKENEDSGLRNKRQNYWDNIYGNNWDRGVGFPTNPWISSSNAWGNNWNSRRYRRSTDGNSDEDKENVDIAARNKRQNYWGNDYGNTWDSRYPTFANPWIAGNNWWRSSWNSHRYRRNTDTIEGENEEKVGSSIRNKRENYWDSVYRNNWGGGAGFPSTFGNPWISNSNGWGSNWNSRRYRRSTHGNNDENKDNVDTDVRNKREHHWDGVYGNNWNSGTGFPSTFGNPWNWRNNWGNSEWNFRRYRRSTGEISGESKGDVDADVRNRRENYWDNDYRSNWNFGTAFPAFPNSWTAGNNWWDSNWNSRRYRRSTDGNSEDNKEDVDSGMRNKRHNSWENVYGNNWNSGARFPSSFGNPWNWRNNWGNSDWNVRRYRRSTGENNGIVNSDVRNKRWNYWDNNYRSNWNFGTGFPTFPNTWPAGNNWWDRNWNSRRYRRSTDGIGEETKGDVDSSTRNKRENYWDNVYGNRWSSGASFPAGVSNPWTGSDSWRDSGWNYRRYRRSAHEVGDQSHENSDSSGRNKRQNYWDNIFGQAWNQNWLSPGWQQGGRYPYRTVFVLSPFFGSWPPNFGQNRFWNRNWNQPPERYFRETSNAQETTNSEDGVASRNKRSLNFDYMNRHGWDTQDGFNPAGDNSFTFSQRNFWNPYHGANNRFPGSGQRFYRNTGDENASDGKERVRRETDDTSRVKRYGNQFWNYQSYPPMYYANSWGQDPSFGFNNWFSPVNPWYVPPRVTQLRHPWYNPFFFGVLRNLRQIKGADANETVGRERREAASKEPRQSPWFNFYNRPFGFDNSQRDNPFWGMPFGFSNPALGGQNLYSPWNPVSYWNRGLAPSSFEWTRGLRETDNEKGGQKRLKREIWGSHVGSGRPFESNWNNLGYGGVDSATPWSSGQRQFWNTNRPGISQQWRNHPESQWGRRFGGYSPVHTKRDSRNAQDSTQDKEETQAKRDVENVNSQRSKRWWRYTGAGDLKPQYKPDRQRGFDHSNPGNPQRSSEFWSDTIRGRQFRRKRDANVEDPLKNKRWLPFESQQYGWGIQKQVAGGIKQGLLPVGTEASVDRTSTSNILPSHVGGLP